MLKRLEIEKFSGRKSDEEIVWMSYELYNKVKEYIMSFARKDQITIFSEDDLKEDWGNGFNLQFATQLILNVVPKRMTYQDKRVIFVRRVDKDIYSTSTQIIIKGEDNVEREVSIRDCIILYFLN